MPCTVACEPGTVHRVDDPALLAKDALVSSRGLGVASALELAGALAMLPATLMVYGIEIGDVAFHTTPSAEVSRAAASVAAMIKADMTQRWPCTSHGMADNAHESGDSAKETTVGMMRHAQRQPARQDSRRNRRNGAPSSVIDRPLWVIFRLSLLAGAP